MSVKRQKGEIKVEDAKERDNPLDAIYNRRYMIPEIKPFEKNFDYFVQFKGLVDDQKCVSFAATRNDLIALQEQIEKALL